MVHMCVKFHSHWTHIASTCFTMCPTDQKLQLDNAHTWMMGFGSNLVWWSNLVVGSCSKCFKANGIPNHALASQCPLAASKLWEFIVGVWLIKLWWNLVEINHMIILGCTKNFTSNGSRKMALPSQSSNLPPQTNEFLQRKIHLGYQMFLDNLARYGINEMWELFENLWSNINRGCFTNLK